MSDGRTIDFSEPDDAHVAVLDRGSLHRVLGARQLFAIGFGDVGSSIYYALGVTTLYALGAVPLALALAGLVFICTVLTYAELSTAIPESGGSCSFAHHAYNDLVAFIAGWALLLDYVVTIAISSYSIGPYLNNFSPGLVSLFGGTIPFALISLGILLAVNIIGIKESTRISLLLTVFGIATQLTIITIGVVFIMQLFHPQQFLANLQQLWQHLQIGVPDSTYSPTWPQFWKGVGMAMVAYIGIESIAELAGEARNPSKTIPRSMFATMITLFVLYFGTSIIALTAMHPTELSGPAYIENPLAGIAAHMPFAQKFLTAWVGLLGATILFVAANAGLIGASRLSFAMSNYFTLPRLFYRVHPRFKTPYMSLIVFTAIAMAIVFFAKRLTHIAELYNFGAMMSFALAHLSLIGLRINKPELERPFRIQWGLRIGRIEIPWTAIIGLLGTTAVWVDVVLTKPAGRNFGFLWMFVGMGLYLWYRHEQKISPTARVEIEKLTVPGYQEVRVKKILLPRVNVHQTNSVQFAARLAKAYDAEMTALYVIEIPPSLPLDTFFPEKLSLADQITEQAQAIGREFEIPVEAQVKQSRFSGETIVETAREGGFDLIILGAPSPPPVASHARSLLGTTVEYVLRNAPCRVWVLSGKEGPL